MNDIVVEKFNSKLIKKNTKIPIIYVYCNPTDYKNKYMARLFDINKPTRFIVIADSLEEIRKVKPKDMIIFDRSSKDEPEIIESWL